MAEQEGMSAQVKRTCRHRVCCSVRAMRAVQCARCNARARACARSCMCAFVHVHVRARALHKWRHKRRMTAMSKRLKARRQSGGRRRRHTRARVRAHR